MAHGRYLNSKPVSDTISLDKIVKLFSLPEWDAVDEYNVDYYFESGAEDDARDEVYKQWHDAVTSAADAVFGAHGLELVPKRGGRLAYEFRIIPKTTWDAAAGKLIDTINGVGMFGYDSVKDFIDVGPYRSAKEAVLSHLHWMKDRADVYGDPSISAKRAYERSWR